MSVILEAKGLSFAYKGQKRLFSGVDFSLERGEIVGITGASGSGKTTLLYCFSGIIPHIYSGDMQGNVYLDGKDLSRMKLPEIAVRIGVLFQNPETQLFSEALVDDVVFGPENLCMTWQDMDDRLKNALDLTGMSEKKQRKPKSLSGGEAQLAALASVLALDPDILIFDEAASQLDERGAGFVYSCALKLKSEGKSVIIVEHDRKRLDIADRILLLEEIGRAHV
jgi:energy-coupling factor transporter ATP-binding protein EcfA2